VSKELIYMVQKFQKSIKVHWGWMLWSRICFGKWQNHVECQGCWHLQASQYTQKHFTWNDKAKRKVLYRAL